MYNQCVTFGDNGWDYAPTKYWPNEEEDYVSFFAYALDSISMSFAE